MWLSAIPTISCYLWYFWSELFRKFLTFTVMAYFFLSRHSLSQSTITNSGGYNYDCVTYEWSIEEGLNTTTLGKYKDTSPLLLPLSLSHQFYIKRKKPHLSTCFFKDIYTIFSFFQTHNRRKIKFWIWIQIFENEFIGQVVHTPNHS